jgi:hypothetical protein
MSISIVWFRVANIAFAKGFLATANCARQRSKSDWKAGSVWIWLLNTKQMNSHIAIVSLL